MARAASRICAHWSTRSPRARRCRRRELLRCGCARTTACDLATIAPSPPWMAACRNSRSVLRPRPSRGNDVAATAKKKFSVTMAEKADIHDLYERSVQAVDVEAEFLHDTYRALRGREALSLREDFCGTASLACEWVRTGPRRHAIGVDIDADVLDWGRRNRVARLPRDGSRARQALERRRPQRQHAGPSISSARSTSVTSVSRRATRCAATSRACGKR